MVNKNKLFWYTLLFLVILFISSCIPNKNSQYPCQIYYQREDCTCPQGLKKIWDYGGYICENESAKCLGARLHTGECVEKCPEGYKKVRATDVNEDATCLPNHIFSEEFRYNETKCDTDNDCIWDNYDSFQCCPCNVHIYNKETAEKYQQWRSKNCKTDINLSDYKWKYCDKKFDIEYCRNNETSPLRCINGICVTN